MQKRKPGSVFNPIQMQSVVSCDNQPFYWDVIGILPTPDMFIKTSRHVTPCNKVVSGIFAVIAGEAILCFKPYFQIVGSSKEKKSWIELNILLFLYDINWLTVLRYKIIKEILAYLGGVSAILDLPLNARKKVVSAQIRLSC